MFGMNGYKILKCFRKEKRVSGELPCPATGLIILAGTEDIFDRIIIKVAGNQEKHKSSGEFDFGRDQTIHFGVTCP